ncbi:hypothetical protein KUTeg_024514 [Tegillarca granosa]|uniref:Phosphodiesterase n=1 Tax=Tegillarca granosa TaxID=220873 RepID=A0ABQ9DXJ7_TEGGR|nr:hypothetical protein KUTeg_024514 [Tegillarca granosa]
MNVLIRELSVQDVRNFLIQNPEVIESHLLYNVTTDALESLLTKKRERPLLQLTGQILSKKLACSVESDQQIYERIEELIKIVSRQVDADYYTIYVPRKNLTELCIYRNGEFFEYGPIVKGQTVAAHVAFDKQPLFVENVSMDPRFPKGTGHGGNFEGDVLCLPVILPTDDFIAVVEIVKNELKHPFNTSELKLINTCLGWMAACIHENGLRRIMSAQETLNDFLLESTKHMFIEMTSIDTVVQNVMTFTKELVNADRCSLFLVDDENNELFADIFDEGKKDENGRPLLSKKSKIRFDKNKGIAGFVLRKGSVTTGYKTKNILCMPIATKSKIHGVVEMINSIRSDHFSHMDEHALQMFAVYCALALHYCRLFNLLAQQKAQYRVAMEVIQYHSVCTEEEMEPLLKQPLLPPEEIPPDLTTYYFSGFHFSNVLPQLFIQLVVDMFGRESFEIPKLCRFVLTVRKNYRQVTYHNWLHGFHVAHCVWCIIDQSPDIFSDFEKMALVIAGICHDVDHRGYNNMYFQKLNLPLASLYSTSVMEQHHYKQTVFILHTKGLDIFSHLSASEYKDMLELIREAIMATDLALYFGNQKSIAKSVEEGTFDLADDNMRKKAKALMMTGADLCAICKPWATQKRTVKDLYEEFFMQGDEEKKLGFDPIPMMDRTKQDQIPQQQIGFMDFICIPLYNTLNSILPGTKPLIEACCENRQCWMEVVERAKEEKQTIEEEKQRKEESEEQTEERND